MPDRFTSLIILDGWGLNPNKDHNAVSIADTPTMDRITQDYPSATLRTSGRNVGLPDRLMGNSEVGHMNLGAGRVVTQAMTQIEDSINDGSFRTNDALLKAVDRLVDLDGNLHLFGLVSNGGVHSWPTHYQGIFEVAKARGVSPDRVFIHAFLDGRDTPPQSGIDRLKELTAFLDQLGTGKIASICGRYYAMDRDQRWERTQRAYDLLTEGKGERSASALEAIETSYAGGTTDEFLEPCAIVDNTGNPVATVGDGDSVIFFNFRGDRPRQLTRAFTDDRFTGFERAVRPDVHYTSLTRYEEGLPVDGIAFPPEALSQDMPRIFGETASSAGKRQLRIAETEKYAHVTFFFNGLREEPYQGEDRILVPSPKDVPTYDHKPEMSAPEIANRLSDAIRAGEHDVAICNFANPDMVGHTGILDAAVQAVTTVDRCLAQVLKAVGDVGGVAIVTADHGNAEQMIHYETAEPHTAHTTNEVPLILVDPDHQSDLREGGALCDIAPTLLGLMGVDLPAEMNGRDLRLT
ncbi:MAG: phosphoglycerate mutase (2,3-diphosphoglycerate-independent) [Gemmatimonadetes bacterium]|nr:phosphoglycerate mutase (2,3-diphosphoglycerate-independent) [Gemmatimonadota bacterium]